MKIGYLRVSTEEQRPDRQVDGLEPICDELHIEKVSAVSDKRPIFEKILRNLKSGDTLVVWDLDRAFRSTIDAITQAKQLQERGIEFQIVTLGIDTSTADGMLVYTVIAAFAEHERNRLSERTKEGLAAAVKRGQRLGRPPKMTDQQILSAQQKIETKQYTVAQLAELYDVQPWTLTRSINRLAAKSSPLEEIECL
uniref:DNA invertase n=1 Tax=OCS116 cluster bacterium TaxID=2030921 RepID=A0A2A4YZC0_9PROT